MIPSRFLCIFRVSVGEKGEECTLLLLAPSRSITGVAVRKKRVRREKEDASYIPEARKMQSPTAWTHQYTFPIGRTQLKRLGLDFA